jgi:TatD DNase family protein
MLIDTHAHVQVHQFATDRKRVISAAFEDQVQQLIVPGIDLESSRDAVNLATEYPGQVFAAVGTHPHDASTLTDDALAAQRTLAASAVVVAVGEIGLDFYRNLSPQSVQREALIRQLGLARELGLPVILHNRESHPDMIECLRTYAQGVTGVFHCFIGDQRMASEALDLGFYLSFAGPVTYPRNTELAEVAAWAPEDRILIETDSPYLAPPPFRGKRNEPRYVRLIAERIAELRRISLLELARVTSRNAEALFRLPSPQTEKGNSTDAPVQYP